MPRSRPRPTAAPRAVASARFDGVSTPSAMTSAPTSRAASRNASTAGVDERPARERSTWTVSGRSSSTARRAAASSRRRRGRSTSPSRASRRPSGRAARGRPDRRRAPRRRRPAHGGRARTTRRAAGDRHRGRSAARVSGAPSPGHRLPPPCRRPDSGTPSPAARPAEGRGLIEQGERVRELGAVTSASGGLPAHHGVVGQPADRLEVRTELGGVGDELLHEGPGPPGPVQLVDETG